MSIEQLANQFLASGTISPELKQSIRSPADRLALYRFVVDREPRVFRALLLSLFDEEISFREALWNGTANDEGEFCEGIYHCAYLIHCCGEAGDAITLWKAQHLNQDVGELDGEYFVGAGPAETLAYLARGGDESSPEITRYIEQWACHASPESLVKWQQGRRQWILEDAERNAS
jgi:hypothetical protein